MSQVSQQPIQPSTLPELEHLLVRAARRRTARRVGRRRWILAVAAASLLLAGGAAAATVFELASGKTAGGTFSIEMAPTVGGNASQGSICLQLTFSGRGPSYGCGGRPTASKPFGLVVADPLDNSDERVVYGLVASAISRVRVLGGAGSEVEVATRKQVALPGRFFSVVAPNDGQIELVGYGGKGREVARLGSLDPPLKPSVSKAQAMEQGDPAGFAPGVAAPETYLYKGEPVDPSVATRLELACLQERTVFRCFDSAAEAEDNRGNRPRR